MKAIRPGIWIALLLAAGLVVGCSKVSQKSPGAKPSAAVGGSPLVITDRIKLGITAPMTGDQAKIGQDIRNGAVLAIKEINAQGGIAGYRVQEFSQDDKHDPREAVVVANRFVSDPTVGAVVGHFNSSCTMPAGAIYSKGGLLEISPGSTNPDISHQGYATFFRTCATDAVQGPSAADYAYDTLGKRRFVVLHDKTTYGEGLARQFRNRLRELKVQELMYSGITQGDTDFNAVLSKVKSLNPDIIYFGGMYPEGSLLAKQAKDMELKAPFIGGDGIMDPKYVQLGGSAVEGCYGTFVSPSIDKLPAAANFARNYQKAFGEVGPFSPYAYDAAHIAMKALEQAIKKDGKKTSRGLEVPREAIIREVRALKDYPGVTGTITFDDYGDPTKQVIYIYQVRGGKWAYIGPARNAK